MKKIILFFCFTGFINLLAIGSETAIQTNFDFSINTNGWEAIIWGKPTNNLRLGWQMFGSKISFYVVNVGQTNINNLIAPRGIQRAQLELHDVSGNLLSFDKSSPVFTNQHYQRLFDVPKNKRHVSIGLLALVPNDPMPFAEVTITNLSRANDGKVLVAFIHNWPALDNATNLFQISQSSGFTLVAKSQIMKINNDTSLSSIESPSVSLPIHLQN